MDKNISIVLGSAFGDEGKGRTVSYLCENAISNDLKPLVIRFNGGHQAGHTVVYNGIRHVFSSFGSGTLQGVPTLWSKYCTVYPIGFVKEYQALLKLGITPEIFIDPLCPITTPYDLLVNRYSNKTLNDGTCGVGFGETIKRHETTPYKLYFMDLFNDFILTNKLKSIKQYHNQDLLNVEFDNLMEQFHNSINYIRNVIKQDHFKDFDYFKYDELIFEGAQGILLDKDYGLYPNVTYSKTTAKNAISLLMDNHVVYNITDIDMYYVTRTYQTRHGNGPMPYEQPNMLPFENETNVTNDYQGKFRLGKIDPDSFKYAVKCNEIDTGDSFNVFNNIVITCNDQYSNPDILDFKILNQFGDFDCEYFISHGPETNNIVKVLK